MITLHHLENSRSQRILWLLEELGLDYEIKRYARDPKTQLAPPELKAVHPLGKSPVITDGEQVIAESGAIVEYLLKRYDAKQQFSPAPESPEAITHAYWLHYAEGSLMPFLLLKLIFEKVERAPLPFFIKPIAKTISKNVHAAFITPNLETHLPFIEQHLKKTGTGYLVTDHLTGADIQMSFPLEAAQSRLDLTSYPQINTFLKTIKARDAYKRALERGGPYTIID